MTPLIDATFYPKAKKAEAPRTLADAMSAIERRYAAISSPSKAQKRFARALRATCNWISEMLEVPPTAIPLDDLVEIDERLITFVEGRGVDRQSAVQYTCNLHKLLDLAHAGGWTSPAFELRKAWQPIRAAIKGHTMGCGSIIRQAIRLKCLPEDFTEEVIAAWKQRRLGKGCSLKSVLDTECHFRRVLRLAGLQHLFPRFSLASKNPPKYRLQLKDLPRSLRHEILAAIEWKTADKDLADRDAALLIRPVTGKNLQRNLVELYSYAVVIRGLSGIGHLPQLITEQIVCGFVDWLLADDRCKPQSIVSKLSSICFLTSTYPELKGPDYRWFRAKLSGIRKEGPGRIQRRKLDGLPDFPSVAAIASKILAIRTGPQKLTELETAWLIHDALIFMINTFAPHRSRNTSEARSDPKEELGLFETEISSDLVGQLKIRLPAWAEELRKKDPRTRFLVGHWLEKSTKAGEEVWEVFPNEVRNLFREYMVHHHPVLLKELAPNRSDPTRLFFARNGNALTQKSLLNLVSRLSMKHANRRMRVKDFRDLVAAHMLATGATVEEIAGCLWHVDPFSCTTTARYYIAGFNASHGTVALEDEIANLIPKPHT